MTASNNPSLRDQALFLRVICERTWGVNDSLPEGECWLRLTPGEVEEFERLATRLDRMAPHEAAIRRIVVGKN